MRSKKYEQDRTAGLVTILVLRARVVHSSYVGGITVMAVIRVCSIRTPPWLVLTSDATVSVWCSQV